MVPHLPEGTAAGAAGARGAGQVDGSPGAHRFARRSPRAGRLLPRAEPERPLRAPGSLADRALRAARALLVRAACGVGVALTVSSAWFSSSGVARAQPQPQKRTAIALVSGGGGPEVNARLRAELSGIGWRVI